MSEFLQAIILSISKHLAWAHFTDVLDMTKSKILEFSK